MARVLFVRAMLVACWTILLISRVINARERLGMFVCVLGTNIYHKIVITLHTDPNSWKGKLVTLMNGEGKMGFDETITEEMAHDIYNKHLSGYYNNQTIVGRINSREYRNSIRNNPKLRAARRRMYDSNGDMDDTDRLSLLDYHNNYRVAVASGDGTVIDIDGNVYPTASNMNYMFWDDALASVAEDYADELGSSCNSLVHNSGRHDDFYTYAASQASFEYPSSNIYLGENIAVTWSTSSNVRESRFTDRIDDMWEEYVLWSYQTYKSSSINGAGHFTQMAWAGKYDDSGLFIGICFVLRYSI